jgi:hypothetical protein
VQLTPDEQAEFDKSCAAVKNLIDDFKKLTV